MTPRARHRLALVLGTALLLTACGITAIGEYSGDTDRDGGSDDGGIRSDGMPASDAQSDAADPDMLQKCIAGCDAGVCSDAGLCQIGCTADDSCQGAPVRCPPGVTCRIDCQGDDSCNEGVDCSGSAGCVVNCTGRNACAGRVTCSGKGCEINCTGATSTCDQGVLCDAGVCEIACDREDCRTGLVACNANDCRIKCGADGGGAAGERACQQGVTCAATGSCVVECLSRDTCLGTPFSLQAGGSAFLHCRGEDACMWGAPATITAGGGASVVCDGTNTCNQQLLVSAGDAGITCRAPNSPCSGGVSCDGGRCTTSCNDEVGAASDVNVCCRANACVAGTTTFCSLVNSCP